MRPARKWYGKAGTSRPVSNKRLAIGYHEGKKIQLAYSLTRSNLGHIVMFAESREMRVKLFNSFLVRLEQLGADSSRLGQLL
jgi:hypothetical protein